MDIELGVKERDALIDIATHNICNHDSDVLARLMVYQLIQFDHLSLEYVVTDIGRMVYARMLCNAMEKVGPIIASDYNPINVEVKCDGFAHHDNARSIPIDCIQDQIVRMVLDRYKHSEDWAKESLFRYYLEETIAATSDDDLLAWRDNLERESRKGTGQS